MAKLSFFCEILGASVSAEGGYRLSLPERFMLAGGRDGDRYLRPPMRWPVDELG